MIPANQEILKRKLSAILFPTQSPSKRAANPTIRVKPINTNKFMPIMAAPKPTANPSNDKEIASTTASFDDKLLDTSTSATSGSAYRCNTHLKLKTDSFTSLSNCVCFLIMDFVMLSNNFVMPIKNKIKNAKPAASQ